MLSDNKPVIEEITPGLYRVEIPLPDNPLRALNSYMIKGSERNLIIDTGMNRTACMEAMQAAIRELKLDVTRTDFFVTHLHVDHYGLVGKLATESSRSYLSRTEVAQMGESTLVKWIEKVTEYSRRHGFYEYGVGKVRDSVTYSKEFRTKEPDFIPLAEGDTLHVGDYTFTCIDTPGHSRGHMCLYEPDHKLFISGDHILGDITPNISSRYNDENPLQEYMDSLDKVYRLDVKLVLPGHRSVLTDLRGRINELKKHHEDRAEEILVILKKGSQNAFDIAGQMTWDMSYETWEEFPAFTRWFAFSEALSHLQYLEALGEVTRHELPDGKIVYSV
jgi:glyoxylase-like metal-dependent hydrolase (beta-lactamase superfamily II)